MSRLLRAGAGFILGLGMFAALGGGALAVLLAGSGSAQAAPTCTTSWKTAVSGDWGTAADWTSGVPTSTTAACITVAGAYTVTVTGEAATAKTLTLGVATGTAKQTLSLVGVGCGSASSLTTAAAGSTVAKNGVLQLTSTGCGGEPVTVHSAGLTISGVLDVEPGAGNARDLTGTFVNSGTATINADTDLTTGSIFTNNGVVDLADGIQWTVDASTSPASTFTNSSTGAIDSSGTLQTGLLYEDAGNNFVEAGTTNVANTYVDTSALTYSGAGASQITTRGVGTLTGAPSTGQILTLQGTGCGEADTDTLTGSATNAGTIDLTTIGCGGNPVTLAVPSGSTLTNTGSIQSLEGAGNARDLTGTFVSSGTTTISADTDLTTGSSFTNNGVVDIADGFQWTVDTSTSPASTFTNGSTGAIDSSGTLQTGLLYEDAGNNFVEAGTTNVANTYVDTSALAYSGAGASQITTRGVGTLTGAPSTGQILTLQGTGCGEADTDTLTGSATNAGTIDLTTIGCGGNPVTLAVPSGSTLTNTGTLQTVLGAGNTRTVTGNVTNTGKILIGIKSKFQPTTLFHNEGVLTVAKGDSLAIANSKTSVAFNDTGGAISGTVGVGGGTFEQGNGTIAKTVTVTNGKTDFVGTGSGGVVAENVKDVLAGTLTSKQSYTIQAVGCGAAATTTTSGAVVNGGTITLTSTGCGGNPDNLVVGTGSTFTNTGTVAIDAGSGNTRTVSGSVVNDGTVDVNANTTWSGTGWDNKGNVDVADSVAFTLAASSASTFTNDTAGVVTTTGDGTSGYLFTATGNTFVEGAGTTAGGPVYVDDGTLTYSGAGHSDINTRGTGTIGGAPAVGQTLELQALGCGEASSQTLTGSATNAGTIVLTSASCGGNTDTLALPSGDTLTNTGTIQALNGAGGARAITGNLVNSGTVGPSDGPTLTVTGNYTQHAAGQLDVTVPTSSATLSVTGTATLAGTLQAVPQSGSTFTAGESFPALSAGTVSGTFSTVKGATGQVWSAAYTSTSAALVYES